MNVTLLACTPNPEQVIASAARVSHGSQGRSPQDDGNLIRKLITLGHESPLEFATATFLIDGISRACANQLTRHRLASFIQESQRYRDVRDRGVVRPPRISECPDSAALFDEVVEKARSAYGELLRAGIPKEDARYVLPLGVETSIVVSANLREWRHIIKLRGSKEAQWEIREVAKRILGILKQHAPNVFWDLEIFPEQEGKR